MHDRPRGTPLPQWRCVPFPQDVQLAGYWSDLAPLDPSRDSPSLYTHFAGHDWLWDYLGSPPPDSEDTLRAMLAALDARKAQQPCLVIRRSYGSPALGYACFWTVDTASGNIEIGNINLSPALQRTPVATEAFSLMLAWAFGAGYRRVERKCNALNAPSRRAAQRLGFSYEGTFRNHMVVRGYSRDTAWFAMTDDDWARVGPAHAQWLAPANFDAAGRQRATLSGLTRPYLVALDPGQRG